MRVPPQRLFITMPGSEEHSACYVEPPSQFSGGASDSPTNGERASVERIDVGITPRTSGDAHAREYPERGLVLVID